MYWMVELKINDFFTNFIFRKRYIKGRSESSPVEFLPDVYSSRVTALRRNYVGLSDSSCIHFLKSFLLKARY